MSDEGRSHVKRHSPFRGTTFWVHYILGDIANRQFGYELFVGNKRIAAEWPLSERAIERAMGELVEGGHLTLLERPAAGRPARYRFEFKGAETDARQNGGRTPDARQSGGDARQSGGRTPAKTETTPIANRIEEQKGTEVAIRLGAFDAFWETYPRKAAKEAARRAWAKATRVAQPDVIIAGAARYRDDPNREPAYTAHPATWLNAGRWTDDPEPPRGVVGANGRPPGGGNDPMRGRHATTLDEEVARALGG